MNKCKLMVVQKKKNDAFSLCISRQKDCDLKKPLPHIQFIANDEAVEYTFLCSEDGHLNIPLVWRPTAYVGMGCTSQKLKGFKGGGG